MLLGATGVTLAAAGRGLSVLVLAAGAGAAAGATAGGCGRLPVEGQGGSGVLEQAARASAVPARATRAAWVAKAVPGRSWYGAKTGAKGFVIVL